MVWTILLLEKFGGHRSDIVIFNGSTLVEVVATESGTMVEEEDGEELTTLA